MLIQSPCLYGGVVQVNSVLDNMVQFLSLEIYREHTVVTTPVIRRTLEYHQDSHHRIGLQLKDFMLVYSVSGIVK